MLDAAIEAQAGLTDLHDLGAALGVQNFGTWPKEASKRLAVGAVAAYAGTWRAGEDMAVHFSASAFQSMHLLDLSGVWMMVSVQSNA